MGERYPNDSQLEAMFADYQRLKGENAALRRLLVENGITIPTQQRSGLPPLPKPDAQAMPDVHDAGVDEHSSKDAKIALFRSLFRGREDVYAFRMRFKSGEWGYVPDLIRDWKAVLSADAALRKKVDQKTRKLLPLTDDVLRQHLEGKQTIGIYPLLPDETCWLLAVDFDKKGWQDDASAFLETCRDLGVSAALERSRSGNGGHVWIFFERAIPASTARKLGSLILTRSMDRHHQLGMDSYDGFFPNQDTMPKGGFGNHRLTPAVDSAPERQQRVPRFRFSAAPRPVEVPFAHTEDDTRLRGNASTRGHAYWKRNRGQDQSGR